MKQLFTAEDAESAEKTNSYRNFLIRFEVLARE